MRPLILEMNAFGPFKDKVIIYFREFNQSSLFLLTGPTGSGKTTIFDAISYVLYGSASGEVREESTLKSHYASDEDLSYVKLKFIINNKTVDVYRRPKQKGPGKTKKVINIDPEFELIVDGQLVSNSVKDSNKEMERLLGLSADQFKQIVMLPQGEFRKLLTSSSTDKEAIFRNIFKTDIFQRFEEKLKEKAKYYTDQNKVLKAQLDQQLGQIKYENHPKVAKAIEQDDYEVIINELRDLISKDEEQLGKTDQELKTVKASIDKLKSYIDNIITLEGLLAEKQKLKNLESEIEQHKNKLEYAQKAKELDSVNKQIETINKKISNNRKKIDEYDKKDKTIQEDLRNIENQYKDHQQNVEKIEAYDKQRQKLEEENHLWKEKLKTVEDIKGKNKEIKNYSDKLKALEEDAKTINKELKKLDEKLQTIPQLRQRLKKTEQDYYSLKDTLVNAQQHESVLSTALEDKKRLDELSQKEKDQREIVSNLAKQLSNLSANYYGNMAIVLAEQLNKNEPCPVCGSLEHPNKADARDEEVSKEELDVAQKDFNEQKKELDKTQAVNEQLTEIIIKQLAPFNIKMDEIKTTYSDAKAKTNELQNELKQIKQNIKKDNEELSNEKEWREEVEALNKQDRTIESDRQRLKTSMDLNQDQVKRLNSLLTAIEDKLTSESVEQVNKLIRDLKQTVQNIRDKETKLKEDLNYLESQKSNNQTSIQLTKETLKENQEELSKQEHSFKELENKYAFEGSYTTYLIDEITIKQWQSEIEAFNKKQIETDTNLRIIIEKLPEEKERLSLDEYRDLLEVKHRNHNELAERRDRLHVQKEANKEASNNINQLLQSQNEILEIGGLYTELSNMATGKDSLTNKISFERYVLGVYFDEILYAANQRFRQMTSDRYELERQTDNFSGRRGNGLDLEVFDQFTGKKRSVNSLSGGEMFKASLSLAFGLSDVIQNELGGVEVNTLFIDEGFGTLDSDSLDQAVQVLMELNQSGRLIGIISHVDELKARIPSKIVVEKAQNGSQIKLQN